MIDQSEIYNLSFEDFIEIDENLKYSEEEFGAAISDLNVNELTDMFIEYLEKNHKHVTVS